MTALAMALAALWSAAVTVIDVRTLRIPLALALSGLLPALAVMLASGKVVSALAGAAAMTALYFLLRLASPDSLGGGDLRLSPTVGALAGTTGVEGFALAAVAAFAMTAVLGLAVLTVFRGRTGQQRRRRIPHGPSMVITATTLALLHLS